MQRTVMPIRNVVDHIESPATFADFESYAFDLVLHKVHRALVSQRGSRPKSTATLKAVLTRQDLAANLYVVDPLSVARQLDCVPGDVVFDLRTRLDPGPDDPFNIYRANYPRNDLSRPLPEAYLQRVRRQLVPILVRGSLKPAQYSHWLASVAYLKFHVDIDVMLQDLVLSGMIAITGEGHVQYGASFDDIDVAPEIPPGPYLRPWPLRRRQNLIPQKWNADSLQPSIQRWSTLNLQHGNCHEIRMSYFDLPVSLLKKRRLRVLKPWHTDDLRSCVRDPSTNCSRTSHGDWQGERLNHASNFGLSTDVQALDRQCHVEQANSQFKHNHLPQKGAEVGYALADFDWQGHDGEYLALHKLCRVRLLQCGEPGMWSFGERCSDGQQGWFPSDYWSKVSLDCNEESVPLHSCAPCSVSSGQGEFKFAVGELPGYALADFQGFEYGPMYLALCKGEPLVLHVAYADGDDQGWALGMRCRDELKGWFPRSHFALDEKEDFAIDFLGDEDRSRKRGHALAEFQGTEYGKEYLTFGQGEALVLHPAHTECDEQGWVVGMRCRDESKGWFPRAYFAPDEEEGVAVDFLKDEDWSSGPGSLLGRASIASRTVFPASPAEGESDEVFVAKYFDMMCRLADGNLKDTPLGRYNAEQQVCVLPRSLSRHQRYLLHKEAQKLGIAHQSFDDGPDRRLHLAFDDNALHSYLVWGAEPPALISAAEASEHVRQQWENWVKQGIRDHMVRVLVLTFGRHPAILQETLLESDMGKRMAAAGVCIHPSWAGGALILVPGVSEQAWHKIDSGITLSPKHVVIRPEDREELQNVLMSIPYRARPRLKPDMPHVEVLINGFEPSEREPVFTQDDCTGVECRFSDSEQDFGYEWQEAVKRSMLEGQMVHVNVRNTFVDFPETPLMSPRSSCAVSAPPALNSSSCLQHSNPRIWE